jgi:signal transduction histidine kinase
MRQRLSTLGARSVVALLLLHAVAPVSAAWAQDQKQVLVIYSTRRDSQIVVIGERELPLVLARGPENLDYYSEYIDQARFPDPAYQTAFRDFLRLKYKSVRFDAIIAVQDAALELVDSARQNLFPGAPIIYFATSPVGRRIENATGLVAGFNFGGTLSLIADLQPEVRQVYVVSGAAPADKEYESLARSQFRPFESRFTMTYFSALPAAELESRVANLPPHSAIYYLLVNREGGGENVHPLEYVDRLASIANAPMDSWVDSTMNRGIVGGSLKQQTVQLQAVGRLALRVLSGEAADSIPVASPNLNAREVDWRQLRRWGISESRVPADTLVRFKEPSVWDRYRIYILGAAAVLVAQTLLIAGLLVQRRRRRQAEEQVRSSEEALRGSYQRIRDLGSRLLHAQDTERSRIARELHDDISQQVALLAIDLEMLSGGVPPDSEALAEEALNRTQHIARSVHDLSHRLHPAKLRLIGLVAALQSLQRELSRAEPTIAFTHDHVPAHLPPDLTVSLFRIVQEAMRNAVKHSSASVVGVHLYGDPAGLVLTVSDDGVGFDVDAAWGTGLGLISMAERIEAIGGALDIRSRPGAGTTLTIRVPLTVDTATSSRPPRGPVSAVADSA